MKKVLLMLFVGILLVSAVSASSVTRSFSATQVNPGDTLNVTLTVVVNGGETYYLIDELYPSTSWIVTNNAGGDATSNPPHIFWSVLSGATSTTYVYSLTVPDTLGTYDFSGTYALEGSSSTPNILGATQIEIVGPAADPVVKINEFVVDPQTDWDLSGGVSALDEWVELYNPGAESVDITGWTLSLIDGTDEVETLSGTIPAGGYMVILNPAGSQNANGRLVLSDALSAEIDAVTYGGFDDGDAGDNAPNGDATGVSDECVARIPNGADSDVDNADFVKTACTWLLANEVSGGDTTAPVISSILADPLYTSAEVTWTTDENANSRVYYGETAGLGSEESLSGLVTSHSISLTGLSENTLYYYKVESCDASANCAESAVDTFSTLETAVEETDDLMINYVRGIITLEGVAAPAGTQYEVEVLSGVNTGYVYSGTVDSGVPSQLAGNGYYDTLDRIQFSSGADFRVSLLGYVCIDGSEDGTFANGGNGDFGSGTGLVNIDCVDGTPANQPPVLDLIGDKTLNEGELLEFAINGSDPEDDTLSYFSGPLPSGATFVSPVFSWTPDSGDVGIHDVLFIVSDGDLEDSETIQITVNGINYPPVLDNILDQVLDENEPISIALGASDPNGDDLIFSVTSENESEVDCSVAGNVLTLTPFLDWHGFATCEIQVSDGDLTDSQLFNIEILEASNAPYLIANLADITWEQDTNLVNYLDLNDYFVDVDTPVLDYNVTGNHFIDITIVNGVVSFYPNAGFIGSENVVFAASDSESFVYSNAIVLTVTRVGNPPEFGAMTCQTNMDEDMGYTCDLNVIATEGDEYFLSIVDEDDLNCDFGPGETLDYIADEDYNGPASCTIRVEDIDGFSDFVLDVDVAPINDAPVLDHISDISAGEGSLVEIVASADDVDGDSLTYDIDDARFTNNGGGSFTWQTVLGDNGIYSVEVSVDDGNGESDSQMVDVVISEGNVLPTLDALPGVSVDENSGLQKVINNLMVYAHDSDGVIDRFEISGENTGKVDCSLVGNELWVLPALDFVGHASCTVRVYDNDNDFDESSVSITVTQVDEPVLSCSAQGGDICSVNEECNGNWINAIENSCCSQTCISEPVDNETVQFNDINVCETLNDKIDIKIKDPDEGDEFTPGEMIDIVLKIGNDFDEDLDFDIDVYLYDMDDDDVIEEDDDSFGIDSSDTESVEFTLEVPEDIDESNDYVLFVKVEEEDGLYCNEEYISLDIERDDDDVAIDYLSVNPNTLICDDGVTVRSMIKNRGSDDNDVYLVVENAELGISERSAVFELEKFDDDDDAEVTFSFDIPEYAEKGVYDIKASVFFDNGVLSDSVTEKLTLGECPAYEEEIVNDVPIRLGDFGTDSPPSKEKGSSWFSSLIPKSKGLLIVDFLLFVGIIAVFTIILRVRGW